jgi:hypothetical protein
VRGVADEIGRVEFEGVAEARRRPRGLELAWGELAERHLTALFVGERQILEPSVEPDRASVGGAERPAGRPRVAPPLDARTRGDGGDEFDFHVERLRGGRARRAEEEERRVEKASEGAKSPSHVPASASSQRSFLGHG